MLHTQIETRVPMTSIKRKTRSARIAKTKRARKTLTSSDNWRKVVALAVEPVGVPPAGWFQRGIATTARITDSIVDRDGTCVFSRGFHIYTT